MSNTHEIRGLSFIFDWLAILDLQQLDHWNLDQLGGELVQCEHGHLVTGTAQFMIIKLA